jgi:hypothetical protein
MAKSATAYDIFMTGGVKTGQNPRVSVTFPAPADQGRLSAIFHI